MKVIAIHFRDDNGVSYDLTSDALNQLFFIEYGNDDRVCTWHQSDTVPDALQDLVKTRPSTVFLWVDDCQPDTYKAIAYFPHEADYSELQSTLEGILSGAILPGEGAGTGQPDPGEDLNLPVGLGIFNLNLPRWALLPLIGLTGYKAYRSKETIPTLLWGGAAVYLFMAMQRPKSSPAAGGPSVGRSQVYYQRKALPVNARQLRILNQ